jgi:hypothetical protein
MITGGLHPGRLRLDGLLAKNQGRKARRQPQPHQRFVRLDTGDFDNQTFEVSVDLALIDFSQEMVISDCEVALPSNGQPDASILQCMGKSSNRLHGQRTGI